MALPSRLKGRFLGIEGFQNPFIGHIPDGQYFTGDIHGIFRPETGNLLSRKAR